MELDKVALDRHITGNYGEDQFRDEDWEEEEDYPDEEDGFITDTYTGTIASFGGKYLGTFAEEDDAREAIRVAGTAAGYWPNVWHVSDHGNHHLVADFWKDDRTAELADTLCYYCGESTTDDPEGEYIRVGVNGIAHASCVAVRE